MEKRSPDVRPSQNAACAVRLAALIGAVPLLAGDANPTSLQETPSAIQVRTPRLAFELTPEGRGTGLLGIVGTETQTQFVKRPANVATARLWRVSVANRSQTYGIWRPTVSRVTDCQRKRGEAEASATRRSSSPPLRGTEGGRPVASRYHPHETSASRGDVKPQERSVDPQHAF